MFRCASSIIHARHKLRFKYLALPISAIIMGRVEETETKHIEPETNMGGNSMLVRGMHNIGLI